MESYMAIRRRMHALLFFLLLLSAGPLAADREKKETLPKGPLLTNNLYFFYLPFINPLPERAKLLGLFEKDLSLTLNYGNTFRQDLGILDPAFFIETDVESMRIALNFDIGLASFLEIGAETAFVLHYGGFCDPILGWFHEIFHFNNQGRETVADNQFHVYVKNAGGIWLDINNNIFSFNNITLKAKFNIFDFESHHVSMALQTALKIPAGKKSAYLSSGKADFAVHLLFEQYFRYFAYYINLGWILLGKPENLNIFGFNRNLFSYMLCLELIISKSFSLYAQFDGTSSPYRSGNSWLDKFSSSFYFGFKVLMAGEKTAHVLQLVLGEEFLSFANAEFSILAGYQIFF